MPQVERDFIGNQKLDGGENGIIVASSVHIVLFWFLLT